MPRTLASALAAVFLAGCMNTVTPPPSQNEDWGCNEEPYPEPASSPYVLPFAPGMSIETGLANCSSSFHGPEHPDRYATDFDLPEGTPFIAARAGTVVQVVQDQPSEGGGAGNFVLIRHDDGTHAYYLHSPAGGITVDEGDDVNQGDELGVVGRSGLAGYPHLHFIVVTGDPEYPYTGIPVSFRNAHPAHAALMTGSEYEVRPW